MKKLSLGQRERLSEIFGNIAVAWFTIGVISPVLIRPENLTDFLNLLFYGLLMTGGFTTGALLLVKEKKS